MASSVQTSMFELVFGGSFKNFKPEVKSAAEIASLGDNILYLKENGRYGIKIGGTAHEFAHVSDLADFATEAWVESAITTAVTDLKDGVAADGDTLAKLRSLIAALDSAKADATTVSTLSTEVTTNTNDIAAINLLLNSNDLDLDTLQEVVDYIKSNKTLLDNLQISNIAGLQAALDSKVSQVDYDTRVAAVDALIASKVSQADFNTRVSAVDAALSTLTSDVSQNASDIATNASNISANATDIADLQSLAAQIQSTALAVVDQVKTQGNAVSAGGSEWSFAGSVPASKKIVGVNIELDGKAYMGYERISDTEIKVVTPANIGSSEFRFQLSYLPA